LKININTDDKLIHIDKNKGEINMTTYTSIANVIKERRSVRTFTDKAVEKDGMDIKQIAEKLNVKREDIRAEMMKLVKSIKEQKTN